MPIFCPTERTAKMFLFSYFFFESPFSFAWWKQQTHTTLANEKERERDKKEEEINHVCKLHTKCVKKERRRRSRILPDQ